MPQPLIGITASQEATSQAIENDRLPSAYARAVVLSGGLPVLIPVDFPVQRLHELRSRLGGLLLSGGGDIRPTRYGLEDDPRVKGILDQRDELEIALVKLAASSDWPLLGICRGQQAINAALGGTLIIDIPSQCQTTIVHDTPAEKGREYQAHAVTIEAGSRLQSILGQKSVRVNSFHHQAVKDVAAGLSVTARAEDGIIEGLELPEHRFFIGVQWHPECLQARPEQRRLFEAFIQAAQST